MRWRLNTRRKEKLSCCSFLTSWPNTRLNGVKGEPTLCEHRVWIESSETKEKWKEDRNTTPAKLTLHGDTCVRDMKHTWQRCERDTVVLHGSPVTPSSLSDMATLLMASSRKSTCLDPNHGPLLGPFWSTQRWGTFRKMPLKLPP